MKTKTSLEMVLALIRERRKARQAEFEQAVECGRWSNVAGYDGIITGLLMAEKTVMDELKYKNKKWKDTEKREPWTTFVKKVS